VFPRLYSGGRPFAWSGYFSIRNWVGAGADWNRTQAGSHLAWWAQRELVDPPDLIGHSYGGSISMLATRVEKQCRGLLLLSPAVHETCLPDAVYYDQILVVRMRFDLVLLLDRSSPQLLAGLPRTSERVLPRRWSVSRTPRPIDVDDLLMQFRGRTRKKISGVGTCAHPDRGSRQAAGAARTTARPIGRSTKYPRTS
jgi:pimeloyl-ACP methyl ester carboxylesterase